MGYTFAAPYADHDYTLLILQLESGILTPNTLSHLVSGAFKKSDSQVVRNVSFVIAYSFRQLIREIV